MVADFYDTISSAAEAAMKVERSEFIGIAVPVSDEAAFFAILKRIERERFDATHHCWAFRLFDAARERARSSDAGEPSGTAGKPILSALEGAALFDVAVVVVRYYGGIKLGTGGLARAYRAAAQAALAAAPRARRFLYDRLEVDVPFDALSIVYRLVSPPDRLLVEERFADRNVFLFDVRRSLVEEFMKELRGKRLAAKLIRKDPSS